MLVKKNDKASQMCVDFTNMNKACLKDYYPLSQIDRLVASTMKCDIFYFLGAFKGYHQIVMAKEDMEKTSIITKFGTYCYVSMLFRLKKAGMTYHGLVNKLF